MLIYEDLISDQLTKHNQLVLNNNKDSEILTYYIHSVEGFEVLEGTHTNRYGEVLNQSQTTLIHSVGHSENDTKYIRSIFAKLDPLIDLDFEEMNNFNGSTIDIYSIKDSSSFEYNALGQTITRQTNSGAWWEILWKDTDGKQQSSSSDQNTIIHEIGHALGLAHPNNDPFDSHVNSFDTVMTYNNDNSEIWNTEFSDLDILALQKIWCREYDNNIMRFLGESDYYKYTRDQEGTIQIHTKIGAEDIDNLHTLEFTDKSLNVQEDIINILSL